jgi:protein associated with RNAse G/E
LKTSVPKPDWRCETIIDELTLGIKHRFLLYYKLYNLSLMELARVVAEPKNFGIENLLCSLKGFSDIYIQLAQDKAAASQALELMHTCRHHMATDCKALDRLIETAGKIKNDLLPIIFPEAKVSSLRFDGSYKYGWKGWVISETDETLVLETHWTMKKPVSVEMFYMETGDVGIEVYFKQRPFNFFFVRGADHKPKGWYCNLCMPPEIAERVLSYRDLILDFVVSPSGNYIVLDENELVDKYDSLGIETKSMIYSARKQLTQILDREGLFFLYYYTFFR